MYIIQLKALVLLKKTDNLFLSKTNYFLLEKAALGNVNSIFLSLPYHASKAHVYIVQ